MVQLSHIAPLIIAVLVITKRYGVRATTIVVQNAFALTFDVLCVSFTLQMVRTRVIRLRVFDGSNARDQIARFYTFHSFLVEIQTKAGVLPIYPNHAGQNLVHKHKTEKIDVVGEKPATKSVSRSLEQTKKSRKITLPKNTAHVF